MRLTALSVHILAGDLGSKGPRELVPDLLILVSSLAVVVSSGRCVLSRRALA